LAPHESYEVNWDKDDRIVVVPPRNYTNDDSPIKLKPRKDKSTGKFSLEPVKG